MDGVFQSIPEFSSRTSVDMAFVTESAATNKSFLSDRPTEPGVPLPLLPVTRIHTYINTYNNNQRLTGHLYFLNYPYIHTLMLSITHRLNNLYYLIYTYMLHRNIFRQSRVINLKICSISFSLLCTYIASRLSDY